MLSNLIQIVELATVGLLFLCVLKVYMQMGNAEPKSVKAKIFKKPPKLTKEQKKQVDRLQTIMDNIDNYNGDEYGQKEVKS
jgi:hypothetical protein